MRQQLRKFGRMLVPRVDDKLSGNGFYKWANRLIWIAIIFFGVMAVAIKNFGGV